MHHLGSPGALAFGGTTRLGAPVGDVDFSMLHRALGRIVVHARDTSLATNLWFGLD